MKHTQKGNATPSAVFLRREQALVRKRAFISMPFANTFIDRYTFGIKLPLETAGFKCERIDQIYQPGGILEHIKDGILAADLVVADLTGQNPNVVLEVGMAYASNKTLILLAEETKDILSNLRNQYHLIYHGSITHLHNELAQCLALLKQHGHL